MAIVTTSTPVSNVNNGATGESPVAFYSANPVTTRPVTIPYSTEWTPAAQVSPDVTYNWIIWGPDDFTGGTADVYRATATGTTGTEVETNPGSSATSTFIVNANTTTPLRTNETSEKYTLSITGDTGVTNEALSQLASQVRIRHSDSGLDETITLINNENEEIAPEVERDWTQAWDTETLTYSSGNVANSVGSGSFRTGTRVLRYGAPWSTTDIPLRNFYAWQGLASLPSDVDTSLPTDSTFIMRFTDTFSQDVIDVEYTSIEYLSVSDNYRITASSDIPTFAERPHTLKFVRRTAVGNETVFYTEDVLHNTNAGITGGADDTWRFMGHFSNTGITVSDGIWPGNTGSPTTNFIDFQPRYADLGSTNYSSDDYRILMLNTLNANKIPMGGSTYTRVPPPGNFFIRIELDSNNFAEYKINAAETNSASFYSPIYELNVSHPSNTFAGTFTPGSTYTLTIIERAATHTAIEPRQTETVTNQTSEVVSSGQPGFNNFTRFRFPNGSSGTSGTYGWSDSGSGIFPWARGARTNERDGFVVSGHSAATVANWTGLDSTQQNVIFTSDTEVAPNTPSYMLVKRASDETEFFFARIAGVRRFGSDISNPSYSLIFEFPYVSDYGGNYGVIAGQNYTFEFWQQATPLPTRPPVEPSIISADFITKFNDNVNIRDFFREATLVGNDAQFTTYGIGDFTINFTPIQQTGSITVSNTSTNFNTPAYEFSSVAISLLGDTDLDVELSDNLNANGIAAEIVTAINHSTVYSAEASANTITVTRTPVGEIDQNIVTVQAGAKGSGNLLDSDFSTPVFSDGTNRVFTGLLGTLEYRVGDFDRLITFSNGSNANSIRDQLITDVQATGVFVGDTTGLGNGIVDFTSQIFGSTMFSITRFDSGLTGSSSASATLAFEQEVEGTLPTGSGFDLSNIQQLRDDGSASLRFASAQPAYIIRPSGSPYIPTIEGGEVSWDTNGYVITTLPTVTNGVYRNSRPSASELAVGETLFDVSFSTREPVVGTRSDMIWDTPLLDTIPLIPELPTADGEYRLKVLEGVYSWAIVE